MLVDKKQQPRDPKSATKLKQKKYKETYANVHYKTSDKYLFQTLDL